MNKATMLLMLAGLLLWTAPHAQAQNVPDFELDITVSDQSESDMLTVGLDPSASDGYVDGEDQAAPPDPPGGFFTFIETPDGNYFTDIRESKAAPATYEFTITYQTEDAPIEISWDNPVFPATIDAEIVDGLDGSFFSKDMNAASTLSVDEGDNSGLGFNPIEEELVIRFTVLAPPEAPSDLSGSATGSTEISLSWTDNADNEDDFEIERSTDGGTTFSALAAKSANATSHTDTSLDLNTEYCYRVRAVNSVGNSAWAGPACVTTPAGELGFDPGTLQFALEEGSNTSQKSFTVTVSVAATNPSVALAAEDDNGNTPAWLSLPASTTVGTSSDATVDVSGLVPGSYNATVTASAGADYADATMDVSLTVTEALETDFSVPLIVSDAGDGAKVLEFGTAPEASDGADPLDVEAPPPAPAGAFDARFDGYGSGLFKDYRPTNENGAVTWIVEFQPAQAPITLAWDPEAFPEDGRFTLTDITGGSLINETIDMRTQSSYTVNLLTLDKLKIEYSLTSLFDVSVSEGWNMLALPLDVDDNSYTSVFANVQVDGAPYGYEGSYVETEVMELGNGYWVKFEDDGTQTVEGFEVAALTLELDAGWNMIGGVSCDLPLADLEAGGLIDPSTLYGYESAYMASSAIAQGKGYWVKANAAGQVELGCGVASGSTSNVVAGSAAPEAFGELMVRDEAGVGQTLLLAASARAAGNLSYAMPPLPPAGAFDVRFADDTRLMKGEEARILVQAAAYPLKVRLNKLPEGLESGYVLEEVATGGRVVAQHALGEAGATVTLDDPSVATLRLRSAGMTGPTPEVFTLQGNYPNPFGQATTIALNLPERAEVEVAVFDLLGRHLFSETHELGAGAGRTVRLDGERLPSGVYLYRVTARMAEGRVISQTGRMTVVK